MTDDILSSLQLVILFASGECSQQGLFERCLGRKEVAIEKKRSPVDPGPSVRRIIGEESLPTIQEGCDDDELLSR